MADGKDKIKGFEQSTKEATTSLKDLRQQLKNFKDEMAGLEEGSPEFLKIAKQAGDVKHQIDEISQSISGASSDFGDMLSSGTKTIQGIMGGFQAAQGALTLFGVESEEVTKAIQKMQASMAIIQGLDAIDNGIKGFKKFTTAIKTSSTALKGFKGALVATGLGALVVVLGSIIANWDEFTQAIGLSEDALNKFSNVLGGVMNVLKGSLKTLSGAITKLVTGDFKGALEQVKNGFDIKALYAEGVEKAITKREKEEQAERSANYKKWLEEYNKAEEERLNIELEQNKRSTASKEEQLLREIQIEKERLNLYKEGSLEREKQLTHIAELEAKVGEDERKAVEKRIEQEHKDIEALQNKYLNEEELFAQNIQKKRDLLEQSLADDVITQEQYVELTKQINDEETAHILANDKKVLDEAEKNAKAKAQAQITFGIQAANSIANILNTLASTQDQNDKESFERAKKLQIASATIQMLTGIATALAGAFTTKSGPWDIALATIQAATIAASGAANIAKIKSTTFDSGSSTITSTPSTSAVSSTIIPPQMYSSAVQGASTEQTIGETKAYVAVTEIDRVSNRVNVAENESRY